MIKKLGILLAGFGIGTIISPNPKNSLLFVVGLVALILGVVMNVVNTSKTKTEDKAEEEK